MLRCWGLKRLQFSKRKRSLGVRNTQAEMTIRHLRRMCQFSLRYTSHGQAALWLACCGNQSQILHLQTSPLDKRKRKNGLNFSSWFFFLNQVISRQDLNQKKIRQKDWEGTPPKGDYNSKLLEMGMLWCQYMLKQHRCGEAWTPHSLWIMCP